MACKKLILILFFIFGIFYCLAIDAQAAPIRIGMSLSLTGRYAVIAEMQARAFRLWEANINKNGGILGRQVQLTIYDDKSDKEIAQKLYHQMIGQEKMDLLLPPYSSGITGAVLPITEANGYPMLIHGAASDSIYKQGYRYAFGVFPPASIYTLGFLEMLLLNNITKIAVISADDTFSKSIAKGAKKWAQRLGIEIVLNMTVIKGTKNLDDVAAKVQSAESEALIMCGHFNESINMRQGLININWYPKAYWASVGPVFQSYYDHFPKEAEGTFTSTLWTYNDKLRFPGSREFYESFVATYNIEPSYHAAAAYTAGIILTSAIKKAGGIKKEKIRGILSSLDMMTLLGRYGVDRTGMQIRFFHLTTQWVNGRNEIVWPHELQTAEPKIP